MFCDISHAELNIHLCNCNIQITLDVYHQIYLNWLVPIKTANLECVMRLLNLQEAVLSCESGPLPTRFVADRIFAFRSVFLSAFVNSLVKDTFYLRFR